MATESSLQRELKQTRPFTVKAEEATVALLRTADLIRRSVGAVLERHDITVQQYNVLRILRGAGQSGLPTLEIAERMVEQTPGITRLADRLEAKGLISRERCLTDRRQVFCRISSEGLDLLAAIDGPLRKSEEAALAMLDPAELSALIDVLERVRNGLRAVLATPQSHLHN